MSSLPPDEKGMKRKKRFLNKKKKKEEEEKEKEKKIRRGVTGKGDETRFEGGDETNIRGTSVSTFRASTEW